MTSKKDGAGSLIPADLAEEYAEIGADKLIEASKAYVPFLDDLGSEIPYVKTLVAAIKLPRTISDFVLGKKVYSFLYSSQLDEAKLEKFKVKFSKAKQEQLWERVVFSVNAHDDKLKSEIIGKLFAALIDEKITENEFFVMVHATNSVNIHVLDDLRQYYMLSYDAGLSASQHYSFATLGLIDIDNSGVGTLGGGGTLYPLNQTGWKYVGIVYDYPNSAIDNIKIGEEELILELNDETQATGQAFPLSYIQSKGSRYREVDIFVVREDGQVLCSEEDDLPCVVASKVVAAGMPPELIARDVANDFTTRKPVSIFLRKMEDTPIQKWAFAARTEQALDNTKFRSSSEIWDKQ